MCPISNNYKNFSRAIEGYRYLKKDINANTYYKHISYSCSNSEGKHRYSNIKGIGRVYLNKQVLLV
jgi:hypothetical protein